MQRQSWSSSWLALSKKSMHFQLKSWTQMSSRLLFLWSPETILSWLKKWKTWTQIFKLRATIFKNTCLCRSNEPWPTFWVSSFLKKMLPGDWTGTMRCGFRFCPQPYLQIKENKTWPIRWRSWLRWYREIRLQLWRLTPSKLSLRTKRSY